MDSIVIKPPGDMRDAFMQYWDRPFVFLAGSIEMGTADLWQDKVTSTLSEGIIFLNPRRDNWDPSWEQTKENKNFSEQVNWEIDGIEGADIVFFYFDPKTKSPISLLELGFCIGDEKKITVCCPDGFYRKGNVDIICSRAGITVHSTLEEAMAALDKDLKDEFGS